MYNVIQKVILRCVIRSEYVTDILKLMILSYLFYQLCWDFDYFALCSDIEQGTLDFKSYDFDNIQNPCPVGDKTDTINLHRNDEE